VVDFRRIGAKDSGFGVKGSGIGAKDSGIGAKDSGIGAIGDSGIGAGDSGIEENDSGIEATVDRETAKDSGIESTMDRGPVYDSGVDSDDWSRTEGSSTGKYANGVWFLCDNLSTLTFSSRGGFRSSFTVGLAGRNN
jgi:hypothetical protein